MPWRIHILNLLQIRKVIYKTFILMFQKRNMLIFCFTCFKNHILLYSHATSFKTQESENVKNWDGIRWCQRRKSQCSRTWRLIYALAMKKAFINILIFWRVYDCFLSHFSRFKWHMFKRSKKLRTNRVILAVYSIFWAMDCQTYLVCSQKYLFFLLLTSLGVSSVLTMT